MPFWKKVSPEEDQRRLQMQQVAEESRRSLEAGGLPIQAQRRLSEEMEQGHPLFTSDLSINEFALIRNAGYVPLSQVMGSSIYQVGWQWARSYSWNTSASELTTVSNAHQHAAQLALGRLEQEAALLRAHGVVGVRLNTRDYEEPRLRAYGPSRWAERCWKPNNIWRWANPCNWKCARG